MAVQRKRGRPFLFAWGFFCVALLPVMGFTDVGFMRYSLVADHYEHIAIIAVVALAAAGWGMFYRQPATTSHLAAAALAVLTVVALAWLTWRQNTLYGNAINLYEVTLEKNPQSWVAHYNLANELVKSGRPQTAIAHFEEAIRLNPGDVRAYNNLGLTLASLGRPQEAMERIDEAIRIQPNDAESYYNMGVILGNMDRLQDAIGYYEKSLKLDPGDVEASVNLAEAYAQTNQPGKAVSTAQRALDLANSSGRKSLAVQIEDWLNSYRARKPNVQDASP